MNANFSKRLIAYIIDFIFISAILMIIAYFIPKNQNVAFLNSDINDLTEQALNNEITFESYFNEYSRYISSIDEANVLYNVISLIIIIIYYVIIPLIFKTTIGKYIMKLEIKEKDGKKLNIYNTFVRSIIDVGIIYSLITMFLVEIVNPKIYLFSLIILGFIQFILVIISIFMILYRHDKRGLQDILSKSNIVFRGEKE